MAKSEGGILGVLTNLLIPKGASNKQLVTTAVIASIPLLVIAKRLFTKRPRAPYPPGPKGNFLVGNLLEVPDARNGDELADGIFLTWAKEYGLVYSVWLPGLGRTVIICDPELAKKVYVTKNYEKGFTYKMLTAIIGKQSLVAIDKKSWIKKRKAFNPGFSPIFLKEMVTTMADKLNRFIKCIDQDIASGEATNMLVRSQVFTSDVIVTVAFGEDWGGDKIHPAREWNNEIARLNAGILFDPIRMYFGFKTKREIAKYEKLIDDEMMAILERRLASSTDTNKDICSLAINEMKEDGPLTEEDKVSITHQLKTFYFAGHDTTAITISWAMWLLSQHDDVLATVRAELKEHGIWKDPETPPTYDDLQKCTYLEATIKETLRLYPPAGGVSRYTTDLEETYNGYAIGGVLLILSIYAMHRHPDLWKEPEVFRPERFLDGSEDNLNAKFLPFSRGPRDCIGKYFAILEAKLAISAMVSRYDLECVDPNEKNVTQLTNVPQHGAQVKFRPRA